MRNLTHVRINGQLYPLEPGHRWLAQDMNGEWYSSLSCPSSDGIWWLNNDFGMQFICLSKPTADWKLELYELY